MSDIVDLQNDIKAAEAQIERRKIAQRLEQNPDFRKLFIEEYFGTEAARLVQLSTDPSLPDEQARADALAMAQATGHAKRYLHAAIAMGAHAERTIGDMQAELVELMSEESIEA